MASSSVSSVAVIQLLIDPELRSKIGAYIRPWMIDGNTSKTFLSVLLQDQFQGKIPDKRLFAIELKNKEVDDDSLKDAIVILLGFTALESEDRASALKSISAFIKSKYLARGIEEVVRDGATQNTYDTLEKAFKFEIIDTEEFLDFSDPEAIDKARDDDIPKDGGVVTSRFDFINRNLTYGGYKKGDLAVVVSSPKCGKTTFCSLEGAHAIMQGKKVAHIALGDMSDFDISCKYITALNGNVRINDVVQSWEQYHTETIRNQLSNLRARAYPPMELDVQQLMAKCEGLYEEFPYDLLIIDYDSNIKETLDNMYKEGGVTYAKMKTHAKNRCAVLVASQPKQQYWQDEVLPLESASESSKKQHAVDIMMTLGRNQKCPKVGSLHLPAVRRGVSRVVSKILFEDEYGRVKEISPEQYNVTLQAYKDVVGSDGDVSVNFSGFSGK